MNKILELEDVEDVFMYIYIYIYWAFIYFLVVGAGKFTKQASALAA